MSFQEIEFKEFVTLQRGFDLPKTQMKDGEVPVLGSNCVIGYHNEAKVEPPGVVTGRSGTLGAVQYIDEPYWPHNTSLWVKDFKDNFPSYVYYKLQTLQLERFNGGASVPTLNRNVLDTLKIKVPDLPTQERIAEVLSAYDDLIENNRRRIKLLEESARLLYREWFVHFRFPGHEHIPRTPSGLPEGWEEGKVIDLGEVVTGKTPSTKESDNFDGDIPFIKTPDMHGNSIVIQTEQTLSEKGANKQAKKFIPPYSVLVSCIGTVGVVSFNAFSSQTNQQINTVIPKEENLRFYSFFALAALKPRLEAMGGGATMANVNKGKFEGMPVIVPSEKLLEQFHEFCSDIFEQIKTLSLQNQKLAAARDILLPRLMNGEVAV